MINVIEEGSAYLLADINFTKLTLNASDEFKSGLISLLNEHNKVIILDLQELSYVDSAFWGALVSAYKYAISMQQNIILAGLRADIRELARMIRLDRIFKVYNNTEEALFAVK